MGAGYNTAFKRRPANPPPPPGPPPLPPQARRQKEGRIDLLQRRKASAIDIQSFWRGYRCRKLTSDLRKAWRQLKARERLQFQTAQVRVLQCWWRRLQAVQEVAALRWERRQQLMLDKRQYVASLVQVLPGPSSCCCGWLILYRGGWGQRAKKSLCTSDRPSSRGFFRGQDIIFFQLKHLVLT